MAPDQQLAEVLDFLLDLGVDLSARDVASVSADTDSASRPLPGAEDLPNMRELVSEPVPQLVPEHGALESEANFQVGKIMCSARKQSGDPCRATPRNDTGLCIYHDPGFAAQRRFHAARGGRKSRPAPAIDFPDIPFAIQDRTSLQVVIDAVLRMELFGRIPLNRSSHILRTLSLALQNLDQPTRIANPESMNRRID